MQYDLEGKLFVSASNSENGDVDDGTLFHYHQEGDLVWADYRGGAVVRGHLIAKMMDGGKLDMRYHHVNADGDIMIGTCISTPSLLPDGRLKFSETWQWLSGDKSSGRSEIVELSI